MNTNPWIVMSPAKEYFTGDWQEEKPDWSKDGGKSYRFDSKDDALGAIKTSIERDQKAEVFPAFTGCRVVNLVDHIVTAVKRKGFNASRKGDMIVIDLPPIGWQKAIRLLPRGMFGIEFRASVAGALKNWPVDKST